MPTNNSIGVQALLDYCMKYGYVKEVVEIYKVSRISFFGTINIFFLSHLIIVIIIIIAFFNLSVKLNEELKTAI